MSKLIKDQTEETAERRFNSFSTYTDFNGKGPSNQQFASRTRNSFGNLVNICPARWIVKILAKELWLAFEGNRDPEFQYYADGLKDLFIKREGLEHWSKKARQHIRRQAAGESLI